MAIGLDVAKCLELQAVIKKPLVLGNGIPQQLQPQDSLAVEVDVAELYRLFQQLLISCAVQGVEPMFDELQDALEIALKENQ